uniref:Uncharacterized protein n=1 Tax=Rhizophora mucronata TaxID=61149 RepID=A0A2P2PI75_RHIMU
MVLSTSAINIEPGPCPTRCCRSPTLGYGSDSPSFILKLNFFLRFSLAIKIILLTWCIHNLVASTLSLVRHTFSGSTTRFCCRMCRGSFYSYTTLFEFY